MPPRSARWAGGNARYRRRSHFEIGRALCGITHGGVRWITCSRSTSGAIAGTYWIAEAPVFLDTANPANVPYYASNGYEEIGPPTGPFGAVSGYPMLKTLDGAGA